MKKAYYIVTIILSGLLAAITLFLAINFIVIFGFDSATFATTLIALLLTGFLAVSIFGLIKKTFILSIILAKLGLLAFGAGALVFSLMAYEHDLGPKPLSFSFISWIICIAFIVVSILLSKKHKSQKVSKNIDKLLTDPFYAIIPAELREYICRAIVDYNILSTEDMWNKYQLSNVWSTVGEFQADRARGCLGYLIVNLLLNKEYVFTPNFKEDPKGVFEDKRNWWGTETKVVELDLGNNLYYLAKVPAVSTLESIYEVKIKEFKL